MVVLSILGMRSARLCGLVVFFFQAEDGIRDLTVTGVQTCALPIFGRQAVREREILAAVLVRLAVGLGVGPGGQEQIPVRTGGLERNAPAVEDAHPLGERVGVIAARGEVAPGVPIDLLFGPAERQDRPSVLPRDREGAGSGLGRLKPVEERGPAEAGWRRAQP